MPLQIAWSHGAAGAGNSSLVDDAYHALKAAIRDNRLPPGYQASEKELARQLGMSRTPVHEAIIRLQDDGLVRVLTRRGVVISAISPDDMREIYDVVIALETMAAELLAKAPEAIAAPVIAELEAAVAEMERALATEDLIAWAKADERFHRSLVERCGNGRIARIAHTVLDQSHRARMFTLALRPKPVGSAGEHRAIVEAIRAGQPDAARTHARTHREQARERLLPILVQYGMRHL